MWKSKTLDKKCKTCNEFIQIHGPWLDRYDRGTFDPDECYDCWVYNSIYQNKEKELSDKLKSIENVLASPEKSKQVIIDSMYTDKWPDPVICMIESYRRHGYGEDYDKKVDEKIAARKAVLAKRLKQKDKQNE